MFSWHLKHAFGWRAQAILYSEYNDAAMEQDDHFLFFLASDASSWGLSLVYMLVIHDISETTGPILLQCFADGSKVATFSYFPCRLMGRGGGMP